MRHVAVGALHDDVGQPLYRLYYSIDGSITKLVPGDPVRVEMERMRDLVSNIDDTLRAELRLLHEGLSAGAGLEAALADLAESTERESGIAIDLEVGPVVAPGDVASTALYRAGGWRSTG